MAIRAGFDTKIMGRDEYFYELAHTRRAYCSERDSDSGSSSFDWGVGSLAGPARADVGRVGLWLMGAGAYSNRASGISHRRGYLVRANGSGHSLQHPRRLAA